MNGFDRNWRRLARAASRAPAEPGTPLDPARIRALAAAGLAAPRDAEPWRWEGRSLAAAAALLAALGLGMWWSGAPLDEAATSLTAELAALPRQLPRAPRLPAMTLPSPGALIAALPDWQRLRAWSPFDGPPPPSHPVPPRPAQEPSP